VALVAGSHKTNYPVPSSLCRGDAWSDYVTEVHAKKGDCVVFGEACTHGALPWRGNHQRRALLYRYSPGHAAYTPGLAQLQYPRWIREMKPEQAKVLLNPGFPSGMREERVLQPTVEQFLGMRKGPGGDGEFAKL
jgi:ectoine hydroxylase-related dioxygenase (phytanoyl-CoA dioxygenase family)